MGFECSDRWMFSVSVRRRHVARAGVAAQPDARSQWNRNGYGR
jgi:hypothetical protein